MHQAGDAAPQVPDGHAHRAGGGLVGAALGQQRQELAVLLGQVGWRVVAGREVGGLRPDAVEQVQEPTHQAGLPHHQRAPPGVARIGGDDHDLLVHDDHPLDGQVGQPDPRPGGGGLPQVVADAVVGDDAGLVDDPHLHAPSLAAHVQRAGGGHRLRAGARRGVHGVDAGPGEEGQFGEAFPYLVDVGESFHALAGEWPGGGAGVLFGQCRHLAPGVADPAVSAQEFVLGAFDEVAEGDRGAWQFHPGGAVGAEAGDAEFDEAGQGCADGPRRAGAGEPGQVAVRIGQQRAVDAFLFGGETEIPQGHQSLRSGAVSGWCAVTVTTSPSCRGPCSVWRPPVLTHMGGGYPDFRARGGRVGERVALRWVAVRQAWSGVVSGRWGHSRTPGSSHGGVAVSPARRSGCRARTRRPGTPAGGTTGGVPGIWGALTHAGGGGCVAR